MSTDRTRCWLVRTLVTHSFLSLLLLLYWDGVLLTDRHLECVEADNISHLGYLRLGEGSSWRRLLRTERQTMPVAIGFSAVPARSSLAGLGS